MKHEFDVFADEAGKQLAHFFDDGVEIHHAGLQDLHAAESEELAGQGGGAIGGAIDLLDFVGGLGGERESRSTAIRCGP